MPVERSLQETLKRLEERRKELEYEIERLSRLRQQGRMGEEDFAKEKKKIEREFIEIMDRIAQMKFLSGDWSR